MNGEPLLARLEADGQRTTSVEVAGQILDLSRATAYRYAQAGRIPAFRTDDRWVVSVPGLREFLEGLIDAEEQAIHNAREQGRRHANQPQPPRPRPTD